MESCFFNINQFDNLGVGDYNIFIEDANGCIEIFEETVGAPDAVSVDLNGDQTIELGESATIEATSSSENVIYSWMPSDILNCLDCPEITVIPFETTTYTVSVIDTISGCTANDEVTITVKKDQVGLYSKYFYTKLRWRQ